MTTIILAEVENGPKVLMVTGDGAQTRQLRQQVADSLGVELDTVDIAQRVGVPANTALDSVIDQAFVNTTSVDPVVEP